ncbi:hypothetical protein LDL08_16115 [Nonomuraea glycinis]|uniref:Uncharacterized protein n=1 Tax=Nonomuraea glycinis TaxID=2047744 RepID=A0A918E4J2_9ACTN|nr:hypothetical protein [Nonomuraea glycinis]MCA2177715.1 hypothetical protein [Nonomuraea glycinis]GGP06785.1 hypothetical protein GCM10012278_32100 [Nonomuraea glycinis]
MSTQPVSQNNLKPFQKLPLNCTNFEDDTQSPAMRKELAQVVTEMLKYHDAHPSPSDDPVYKNSRDELVAIKEMMQQTRLVGAGKMLCLVTRHDGKIQGLAVVSRLHNSLRIDQASAAPWNIVPPAVSEANSPNPFRGVGWQMVSVALTYCGVVDLTAATEQSAQSFNKMGFLTREGKSLQGGDFGVLEGAQAQAFKQKLASFG